jgi:hypothetical protein
MLASSSEIRALMGPKSGLADRDTSICGNASLDPFVRNAATLTSSSTTESRFRGSIWRKPSSLATFSILLKYCSGVSNGQTRGRLTYLDRLDLQLHRGVLVADDHWMGMHLERREGPHVIDALFQTLLQREGFVGAGDDDDDLACLAYIRAVFQSMRRPLTSNTVCTPTVRAIRGT